MEFYIVCNSGLLFGFAIPKKKARARNRAGAAMNMGWIGGPFLLPSCAAGALNRHVRRGYPVAYAEQGFFRNPCFFWQTGAPLKEDKH